jgi:hypothetical protein
MTVDIRQKVLYYETMNRELNKRLIHECRCDERRKVTGERSTHLTYTVLSEGLEHIYVDVLVFIMKR